MTTMRGFGMRGFGMQHCAGFGRVLYLSTSQRSYVFNCAEGTQRLSGENNMFISR